MDEVEIASSIDKECPIISQADYHLWWNRDYKSLKNYLQKLRTFNLENKDAPRVKNNDDDDVKEVDQRNDEIENSEIEQRQKKERAQKEEKQALQFAHMITSRFNKDQNVNLEFVRVVRVADTGHPLVRRIVVEVSNPDTAAGFPPVFRLEATFNWYIGKPHRPSYLLPPYPASPSPAPAASSSEVQVQQKAQANKVVTGHEHNDTASTQPDSNPTSDKIKRFEMGNFDDGDELNLKELKRLHKKEVDKKGVGNLTALEACKEVLGKGHTTLVKDDKKSRAEMQSGVQLLQEVRDEIKFLKEESLRQEKEAKEREERLEKKLQMIMEKFHLTV